MLAKSLSALFCYDGDRRAGPIEATRLRMTEDMPPAARRALDAAAIAATLSQLAREGDLSGFASALSGIPVGRLAAVAKEDDFHASLAMIGLIATDAAVPRDRLNALALLGKADRSTQRRDPRTGARATFSLRNVPPPLVERGEVVVDKDAREYIAGMLDHAEGEWVAEWATRALLDEAGSDYVRRALATQAFARAPSLTAAFRLVAECVPGSLHERPGRKDDDLARHRRIARLFNVLEETVRSARIDSGADLVQALNAMLLATVFRFAPPVAGNDAELETASAARAVLGFLSTLVRSRFSISADPESYAAVPRLRRWFGTAAWPAPMSEALARTSQSLREAIALRARMQLTSRELLSVLISIHQDRDSAVLQLAVLAEQPGVPPEVQDWLRSGGLSSPSRKSDPELVEAGMRDSDELIARAAILASKVRRLADGEAKAAVVGMRELQLAPELIRPVNQLMSFARALPDEVSALLGRRSMELFGESGETVQYDPSAHVGTGGTQVSSDRVRIVSPGARRVLPNGTRFVLQKATVQDI